MGRHSFKTVSIDEFLELTLRPDLLNLIKKEHHKLMKVKLPGTIANFSRPENSSKNRSTLFPCWDESRVILKSPSKGIPYDNDITSTYIHANFVDGFKDKNKFICSQSPMENTCEDFWRMILQENCHIIVSLTKVDNAVYCYEYWANEKYREKVFGKYVIKTLEIIEEEVFTRSRLLLTDTNNDISQEIHHFWYTNFPLHYGWPIMSPELLNLIFHVDQKREELMNTTGSGPIVIHCSKIVSWTGIFCTIYNALSQVREEKTVSLPQTVLNIRKKRHSSIMNWVEYEICYRVLCEAILNLKTFMYCNLEIFSAFQDKVAAINFYFGKSHNKHSFNNK
ncbi:PTP 1 [Bracoviriform demolitoris]|uniref:Tyrosine phosphatase-like protein H1 n=1 Tax=Microplitis demolitor bracovirus (isolate Webb) TaxID=654919 RepID=PTPH1_MDBVW|nr:receptor-type tyrosine-protein phosphatase alpha [Microplitis demolitor]YP_239381.1 PTP 1 [Bracoviriform demolitoris]Q5I147.1 RecName: Full=Tyrosine phosphatase-like protein H1; Short=PTP-H1 [Microplitis demolitor bracovirus (isolate Webb)]AAW51785.1 PTP 1 [Bracoviriform demolitoris]KAG6558440.1 protein tyrosine phosphatase H1 [Microplitis demolitor]